YGANEILELLVLGDEIGLAIDLDRGALLAVDGDSDEAFRGGAAGLLGGGGEALGAQPVDRGFHVATGLAQRLLAVHHAGAGALAQFLDTRGRDLSHVSYPFESKPNSNDEAHPSASASSTGGSSIAPRSSPRAWAPPCLPPSTASAIASQ